MIEFIKKNKKIIIAFIIIMVIAFLAFDFLKFKEESGIIEVSFVEFKTLVESGNVEKVSLDLKNDSKFIFTQINGLTGKTDNPKIDNFKEYLLSNNVKVTELDNSPSLAILSIVQMFIYLALILFILKRMVPSSKQEVISGDLPKVTFDDIAGEQELKNDLKFAIEFLKNPNKYSSIGARMPRGIVLYGPPGTGKTLTAKAIAGTAGVPFFSVSGSDFVEMYVGLGARRVRNLYKEARKKAPCIVFIDEIDAVGGQRGDGGMNSEKDQTINALLKELDGFSGAEGVLTICATNRLELLDNALIRPGRFDKQLAVPLPERKDRVEILKVHGKNKKFDVDVIFDDVANMTVGFSGASLEALLNEAAIIAITNGLEVINSNHIETAFYKTILKGDKKNNQNDRDIEELKIVAYHEAAHAFATRFYTEDSVSKITILSYTSGAGGVTFRNPKEMALHSKEYIESLIKVMYAGRASEEILLKNKDLVTTGASQDIKQATKLIKEYISVYGMNDKVGMINTSELFNNNVPEIVLTESSILSNKMYEIVKGDIKDNFKTISAIAETLLEKETISGAELDKIISDNISK